MPDLTRRRFPERPDCWHVYYGDVHVGEIACQPGVPVHVDQWGWSVAFYPLDHRGKSCGSTAATFDLARAGFEAAWKAYLPLSTEDDFAGHRQQRAWIGWKYAMHDAGLPLPTQMSNGRARCFCGVAIDIKGVDPHIREAHMMDVHPA